MDQDRLRHLDALFAEKVLGCKVGKYGNEPSCDCNLNCPHGEYDNCCGDNRKRLARYTRSLDAAFEASKILGACCRKIDCDHDYLYRAAIYRDEDHEVQCCGRSKDHPAEALVLACLRAVGVNEEELK